MLRIIVRFGFLRKVSFCTLLGNRTLDELNWFVLSAELCNMLCLEIVMYYLILEIRAMGD